ncbi:MAG: hypothetical protein QNJ54_31715 [Prochloraceae cyanobacterium]|nr:hypothetical protein [Prochloraceae cyanobacterium]
MSFTLHNLVSYTFEKNKRDNIADVSEESLDPMELQAQRYEVWKQYEDSRPVDADSWSCSEGLAEWLYSRINEFSFSSKGLHGEQKATLTLKLQQLATNASCPLEIVDKLNSLSQFLDKHPIVFTY